jgi:hypothetical protein
MMFLSVINFAACGHNQQTGFIPHVVMTFAHTNAWGSNSSDSLHFSSLARNYDATALLIYSYKQH